MAKPKLLVFMIDALCEIDVEYMRTLPNFGWMLENGALVKEMKPVYPSFTYPCHTSIMTGCYPDKHGIPHNEQCTAGVPFPPWYRHRSAIKKRLFAEYAKDHGFTTCLLNWPVSAGADVDINYPMALPYHYVGDNPRQFFENGEATQNVLDMYFWKYEYMLCGQVGMLNGSLDGFVNAIAPEIIRDFHQPDVMFVKMCDLDTIRHRLGVVSDEAKEQLRLHDMQLGVIMEAIRRYGDFENTNFVVMGDHGQTDIEKSVNFNKVLQLHGLQELDENGKLVRCDAYCYSTGASGWVEVTRDDDALRQQVYELLCDLRDRGEYGLSYVFTKEEVREKYHLAGPFDFVIESKDPVSFAFMPDAPMWVENEPGDYKTSPGTHGGLPERDHRTTFFACGKAFKKGAVLDTACLVDEAPTLAKILGFEMPDIDGHCMDALLNE